MTKTNIELDWQFLANKRKYNVIDADTKTALDLVAKIAEARKGEFVNGKDDLLTQSTIKADYKFCEVEISFKFR